MMGYSRRKITPKAAADDCPCYGCQSRRILCHSDCVSYEKWRAKYKAHVTKYNDVIYTENKIDGYVIEQKTKMKKKKGTK